MKEESIIMDVIEMYVQLKQEAYENNSDTDYEEYSGDSWDLEAKKEYRMKLQKNRYNLNDFIRWLQELNDEYDDDDEEILVASRWEQRYINKYVILADVMNMINQKYNEKLNDYDKKCKDEDIRLDNESKRAKQKGRRYCTCCNRNLIDEPKFTDCFDEIMDNLMK